MVRPSARRSVATAVLLAALAVWTAPASSARDVVATDGESRVTIMTPIRAPAMGSCTRVPYPYAIAADVQAATAVIIDASGALVARGSQLQPGEGTGELNVCAVNLSGRTSPFTLQLRIAYAQGSARPATTVSSSTFGFAPRTIRCRKATPPRKGRVQTFTARTCPPGWRPVR